MRYSQEDDYEDEESKFNENRDFFDDDDDDDDDDFEFEMMDRKFQYEKQKIKIIELGLKQQYLRRIMLLDAINISQKSFWWNFLSFKTKIKWITDFYEVFVTLVLGPVSEEVEEENILDEEEEI